MNLATLKRLEAAASPAPWTQIPWTLTATGLPTLSGANRELLLLLRNAAPQILDLIVKVDQQSRALLAVQATFEGQRPTSDTPEAQMDFQEAAIQVAITNGTLIRILEAL